VVFIESSRTIGGVFVKETRPAEGPAFRTPILMVHGASHGWWAYEQWLSLFALCGWRSCALSLRNHSGSRKVPEDQYVRLTVEDYVADVSEVLSWLEVPPVLIGHSMGGIVAQKAAERHPLHGLVLLASVGPGQLGKIREPLPADRGLMFTPEEARSAWFYRVAEEDFQAVYDKLVPESPSVMNEYSSGAVRVDRWKITCPVLVIGAEHDRTAVHGYQRVADFYQCDRMLIRDAGHDFMLEPRSKEAALRVLYWILTRTSEG
jgi:pimeloyl-ACP methyl ester carboxylesterase